MLPYTTPHTVRVDLIKNELYALIVTGINGVKSFFLVNESTGDPVFMFACKTDNDRESVELVIANAAQYIPEQW